MPAISQSELPKYNCILLLCSKVQLPEMWLNYACINKTAYSKGEDNRNGLISIWTRNLLMKWSKVAQSCPTLCEPMGCSPPCSSIHGIFQARVLEWVAISFSRGSSRPRDRTWVSCIGGRCFSLSHQGSPLISVSNRNLWIVSMEYMLCFLLHSLQMDQTKSLRRALIFTSDASTNNMRIY